MENEKLHTRVDEMGVLLDKVMGQMSEMVAEPVSPPSSISSAQKTSPVGRRWLLLGNALRQVVSVSPGHLKKGGG